MKATINGRTYDTAKAEEICTDASPDGSDILYRTKDGSFFVVLVSTFVDGVRLRPNEEVFAFEEACQAWLESGESWKHPQAHITQEKRIVTLSDREALVWCVKTQIPECFRGCVLESI